MTVKATIIYTMKETHPDKDYVVGGWSLDKEMKYMDTYHIKDGSFWSDDAMYDYIKRDLMLVAGGGYNWDHIDNVRFEMEVA